jgi:hypothetical protein
MDSRVLNVSGRYMVNFNSIWIPAIWRFRQEVTLFHQRPVEIDLPINALQAGYNFLW